MKQKPSLSAASHSQRVAPCWSVGGVGIGGHGQADHRARVWTQPRDFKVKRVENWTVGVLIVQRERNEGVKRRLGRPSAHLCLPVPPFLHPEQLFFQLLWGLLALHSSLLLVQISCFLLSKPARLKESTYLTWPGCKYIVKMIKSSKGCNFFKRI